MMKFGILSGEPLLGVWMRKSFVAEDFDGFRPIVGTDFPVKTMDFWRDHLAIMLTDRWGDFQMAEDAGWEHPLQNSL